jgi:hypothetical protein
MLRDLGEAVEGTTGGLGLTADKEVEAGGVMRVVSQKDRNQCRRVEKHGHLK